MTLYFIYLLISWSHSSFHLFNQKSDKRKKNDKKQQQQRVAAEENSEVFFYLFLPCTLLYRSIYGDFYLYMCKKANINGVTMD